MNKEYSINSILYPSGNSNLDGLSTDIFFIGCKRRCKGCHNYELQEFRESNYTLEDIVKAIKKADKANIVTILGGEPLDVDTDKLIRLIDELKKLDKKISIFTGYELNQVPEELLDRIDYIKTGMYDETNKTPYGYFLATKNQKMYKKEQGKWVIQWEYYEGRQSKY